MLTDDGKHLYVSWDEYHLLIERLAIQVHKSGWEFDQILCLARGGLRPGDVLFVAKGNRNFAVSVDHSIEQVAIQAVAAPVFYLLRCHAQLLPEYLAWWLNQEPSQRYFEQNAEGSQVKSIRRSVLAETPLALPALRQQAALAALQQNLRQQQQTLQQLISNGVQLQRRIANDFLAAATGDGHLGGTTP